MGGRRAVRAFFWLAVALVSLPLVSSVGFLAWMGLTFEEKTIREGEAYGFVIGESSEDVYLRALALKDAGEIAEIRRGSGSAARILEEHDIHRALADDAWKLVVNPDWWNDSITLRFRERHLVEIYRFRICCEMP
jgi:hypothetical protein